MEGSGGASGTPNEHVEQRLVALHDENRRLSEQIKRLVKTEHELYQFQEQLDEQVRIYHHLYEIGKKLNATLDLGEILQIATQFPLYQLNFERCVVLLYHPEENTFCVEAHDGYYDEASRARVTALRFSMNDPALASSLAGSDQIICAEGCNQRPLLALGQALEMDEYVAFSLGGEPKPPIGLLIAGNTLDNTVQRTRIQADSEFVVGLANLASQVATTIRMRREIQAREQRLMEEAHARERIEQELRVARRIQHALLPKDVPALFGWEITKHYQPAREVGGDFYDFLKLEDGRVGLIIGDVSGKGIPAAVLMASTRSVLRAVAQRALMPGQVLAEANEVLSADVPPSMFVTCFYSILDPSSGRFHYANAGHNLPYWQHEDLASEMRATGMPLGLLPGMQYEEKEAMLVPGDTILFYSDGLVEAHNAAGEMFGDRRLQSFVTNHSAGGESLITELLVELAKFTGADGEQEDDITLVRLQRSTI
jgi:serine phosphatase RsbU (regulator of sigma subunit)